METLYKVLLVCCLLFLIAGIIFLMVYTPEQETAMTFLKWFEQEI